MAKTQSPTKRSHRGGSYPKGESRRKLLIESAEALLSSRSAQELTYPEIAERAGLPLSSCYHFYRNKFALFQAVDQHLGVQFRKYLITDMTPNNFSCWEDIINELIDRGRQFVDRNPSAKEIWFSGNIPPAVREQVKERGQILGTTFKHLLAQHFVLPEIPNSKEVFFIAMEVLERFFYLAYQNAGGKDFYFEEGKKNITSYLRCYIPPYLVRKDYSE